MSSQTYLVKISLLFFQPGQGRVAFCCGSMSVVSCIRGKMLVRLPVPLSNSLSFSIDFAVCTPAPLPSSVVMPRPLAALVIRLVWCASDGEGLMRWKDCNKLGNNVVLELPGYHIPTAGVQLLSPQVLLTTVGGQAIQTTTDLKIHLNNRINLLLWGTVHITISHYYSVPNMLPAALLEQHLKRLRRYNTFLCNQSKCVNTRQQHHICMTEIINSLASAFISCIHVLDIAIDEKLQVGEDKLF